MTGSIRGPRRAAVLLAGAAVATTLLVSGCSTGQIAQTADMAPHISGVNAQTADNIFQVRNLSVVYRNIDGYPAGENAPLEVALFNESQESVTVRVTSSSARSVVLTGRTTPSPEATGSPSTTASTGTPSPEASAAVPDGRPAEIQIPAGGFVLLDRSTGSWLELVGLNAPLRTGGVVDLVFDFNGQRVETLTPVALPFTPAPLATPVTGPEGGHS